MATIFTHALVPLAARTVAGREIISTRLLWLAAVATILPDADVVSFYIGIPYSDPFGHRGFTHSIAFACLVGVLAAAGAHLLKSTARTAFWLVFASTLSHPLLDSLTNGGLGVAWFWPVDSTRYFMPWQPLEVSPIGARFFSERGMQVIVSELVWVIAPLAILALGLRTARQRRR